MGNNFSSEISTDENEVLNPDTVDLLDKIFSEFILKMDAKGLTDLQSTDYCDKLIIVTKDILENNFEDFNMNSIYKRIQNGITPVQSLISSISEIVGKDKKETKEKLELEELEKEEAKEEFKPKKSFFLSSLQEKNNLLQHVQKEERQKEFLKHGLEDEGEREKMCERIAKFYIRIAHIYASILKALNPRFVSVDPMTQERKFYSFKTPRNKLPAHVQLEAQEDGFCVQRIRKLMHGQKDTKEKKRKNMIEPAVCGLNEENNNDNEDNEDSEQGFDELTQLYFDEYGADGTPSMSSANKKQFRKDLLQFYNAFALGGEEDEKLAELPADVKTFRDIKIKSYKPKEFCKGPAYLTDKNKSLFYDYAQVLRELMTFTKAKHTKLKEILNEIFQINTSSSLSSSSSSIMKVKINNSLTESKLETIMSKTRNVLIELYYGCEEYFQNALKIYEALVESQVLNSEFLTLDSLHDFANEEQEEYDDEFEHEQEENQEQHKREIEKEKTKSIFLSHQQPKAYQSKFIK